MFCLNKKVFIKTTQFCKSVHNTRKESRNTTPFNNIVIRLKTNVIFINLCVTVYNRLLKEIGSNLVKVGFQGFSLVK
jgi:hypothetical protein